MKKCATSGPSKSTRSSHELDLKRVYMDKTRRGGIVSAHPMCQQMGLMSSPSAGFISRTNANLYFDYCLLLFIIVFINSVDEETFHHFFDFLCFSLIGSWTSSLTPTIQRLVGTMIFVQGHGQSPPDRPK